MRSLGVLVCLSAVLLWSCGDDAHEGSEGEPCFENGSCNPPLTCVEDVCEDLCGDDVCDAGEDTSSCPQDCPVPGCGNDLVDGYDLCDGQDLAGHDCVSRGFTGGTLACLADCSGFDTSGCNTCGNGEIEGQEVCDGSELGGEGCLDQGFDGGELLCGNHCLSFVTSNCWWCGNGVLEGDELCDATALAGESCQGLGFDGGGLVCTADCQGYDTASCLDWVCDGQPNPPSACGMCGICAEDGPCLAEVQACQSSQDYLDWGACAVGCAGDLTCIAACGQTFPAGYALAEARSNCVACQCQHDCAGTTSVCTNPTCGNGTVDPGEACDGANLMGVTCELEGYFGGSLSCSESCLYLDTSQCASVCGNAIAEPDELCDGVDLNGHTCENHGYPNGGTPACDSDCQTLDLSGCIGPPSCEPAVDCSSCSQCAGDGPCAADVAACTSSSDCLDIMDCVLATCAPLDQVCISNCDALHPSAAPLFHAAVECIYCDVCPTSCVGYWSCP